MKKRLANSTQSQTSSGEPGRDKKKFEGSAWARSLGVPLTDLRVLYGSIDGWGRCVVLLAHFADCKYFFENLSFYNFTLVLYVTL